MTKLDKAIAIITALGVLATLFTLGLIVAALTGHF